MQPGNESRCDVNQMAAENKEGVNSDHGPTQGRRLAWRAPEMQILALNQTRNGSTNTQDTYPAFES